MTIEKITYNDLKVILALQKTAFKSEAALYNDFNIQPLKQSFKEIETEFKTMTILKAIVENQIVGSVRGSLNNDDCYIGKLIVHPLFQNCGIGKKLVIEIEKEFNQAGKYRIFTGYKSEKNIGLYSSLGYSISDKGKTNNNTLLVFMEKINRNDNT